MKLLLKCLFGLEETYNIKKLLQVELVIKI